MTALAFLLAAVLVALAVLHLAWALGHVTPMEDEAALARAVVGTRGITRMPGAVPCALVAMALTFCAILPLDPRIPGRALLMPVIAAVFLARGIAPYVPAWRRLTPEEPFATLDRRFYGPLCLGLGAVYLILTMKGF